MFGFGLKKRQAAVDAMAQAMIAPMFDELRRRLGGRLPDSLPRQAYCTGFVVGAAVVATRRESGGGPAPTTMRGRAMMNALKAMFPESGYTDADASAIVLAAAETADGPRGVRAAEILFGIACELPGQEGEPEVVAARQALAGRVFADARAERDALVGALQERLFFAPLVAAARD